MTESNNWPTFTQEEINKMGEYVESKKPSSSVEYTEITFETNDPMARKGYVVNDAMMDRIYKYMKNKKFKVAGTITETPQEGLQIGGFTMQVTNDLLSFGHGGEEVSGAYIAELMKNSTSAESFILALKLME